MGAACSEIAKAELLRDEMQPSPHKATDGCQLRDAPAELSSGPVALCSSSDSLGDANVLSAVSTQIGLDSNDFSEQMSFASISSHLRDLSLLVDPKEVIVKKELCTTCKSTVSISSWKGNLIAAKQLKVDLEEDWESKENTMKELMNEITILSEISHPCLVKLLGANLDSAEPLILTELLENQDVETLECNIKPLSHNFQGSLDWNNPETSWNLKHAMHWNAVELISQLLLMHKHGNSWLCSGMMRTIITTLRCNAMWAALLGRSF